MPTKITFAAAREVIFAALEEQRWDTSRGLKVPSATMPHDVREREIDPVLGVQGTLHLIVLLFRPQSLHACLRRVPIALFEQIDATRDLSLHVDIRGLANSALLRGHPTSAYIVSTIIGDIRAMAPLWRRDV